MFNSIENLTSNQKILFMDCVSVASKILPLFDGSIQEVKLTHADASVIMSFISELDSSFIPALGTGDISDSFNHNIGDFLNAIMIDYVAFKNKDDVTSTFNES